jgi:hypothetical protein
MAISQSVQFACGLKAAEFIIMVINLELQMWAYPLEVALEEDSTLMH